MNVRLYLRASTTEQDASRAEAALESFAEERGLAIQARYIENESGAKLQRPELFRLLRDARPGDMILLEAIDRLSRLSEFDWRKLRTAIEAKQLRVVAMDLPTSWQFAEVGDEFMGRVLAAVNSMMLDLLAAGARKDYEDRRRRQGEGIAKRKAGAGYAGRPENVKRNKAIEDMLQRGMSWSQVQTIANCSRSTVARIADRIKPA